MSLDEFEVRGARLLRNGKQIAEFPTPICELARADERLFLVLHPYPIDENPEYAAQNLWCVDVNGTLLWKVQPIKPWPAQYASRRYHRGLCLFRSEAPRISIGSGNDRYDRYISIETGQEISSNPGEVEASIFTRGKLYLYALGRATPQRSSPDRIG